MSYKPETRVAKHLIGSGEATINTVEYVAPLEGTLIEIEELEGTMEIV